MKNTGMILDSIFPTTILHKKDFLPVEESKKLYAAAREIKEEKFSSGQNEWFSNIHNTIHTYELHNDERFVPFLNSAVSFVNDYNNILGSDSPYLPSNIWLSSYNVNQGLDTSFHPGSTYCFMYFLSDNDASPPIIFQNPNETFDMLPIEQSNFNDYSYKYFNHSTENNKAIVFRSFLRHKILTNLTNSPMFTVTMTFNPRR